MSTATYDDILRLEKRLNEADSSSEVDTSYILKELLADACVIVGPKGELYSKEFIMNAHGPKRVPFQSVHVNNMNIKPYEDTALVHSLTTYKTNDTSFDLRFFRVWKKHDGQWQVVGGSTTIVPKD